MMLIVVRSQLWVGLMEERIWYVYTLCNPWIWFGCCSCVGSGTHRDISSSFDDMFDKRASDGVDDMLDQRSSDGVFQS